MTDELLTELPAGAFDKQDAGDNLAFCAPPRLVTPHRCGRIAALASVYRAALPAGSGSRILDVMSSWNSHPHDDRYYAEIIGYGMKDDELAASPRLGRRFVQDLSRDPALPLDKAPSTRPCAASARNICNDR